VRINRVVLENYGLYLGKNEIDLVPRQRGQRLHPIVLIGGMNGTGKTTLLDAVRLALYGKSAAGDRLSEKAYQDHLRGLVHRSRTALINFDYARIGVEFDLVLRGTRDTYYVQRCWSLKNASGVQEKFQVYKRDTHSQDHDYNSWPTLPDIGQEHWQAFVNDVVPERLSQLFFFDGEKIKRIADDISGDTAIAEAIRSLLGLDTVSTLKADLTILAAREAKRYVTTAEASALDRTESEIQALQETLEALERSRPELETAIHGIQAEMKRLETRLREEGGAFAQDRSAKQAREAVLDAAIENIQKDIRQECEGLLPLALCPRLTALLETQVEKEGRLRHRALLRAEIGRLEDELILNLSAARGLKEDSARQKAIRIIRDTIAARFGDASKPPGDAPLLGFSDAETNRLLSWLHEAREKAAPNVGSLCDRLEAAERELQEIRRHLQKAPEQIVLDPIFNDLAGKNQDLGQAQADLTTLDEKIHSLKHELAAKERERYRLLESGRERAKAQDRIHLIANLQKGLDKYLARLTQLKVEALCRTVAECFNRLSRKEDLLHGISINPQSFSVTLHDQTAQVIPREQLSAGEKQILAISILWGLSKTSGRPLPVIIDTPLGRLDSQHRMNLVQNYFPHAGHQVILLSTDTEVDKPLFEELKPYVSHCYNLVYDTQERRTYPREEYFWKDHADA
jgi:DNA sulfur modification protein DndD